MKAFIHTSELDTGGYPDACPFNTRRAGKTRHTIIGMGLLDGKETVEIAPQPLTEQELQKFHTPDYLDALQQAQTGVFRPEFVDMGLGTPDCPVFDGMYDFCRLAAGGTVTAARLMLEGRADIAFNPSGGFHHAAAGAAAGFCYINDIVLAAMELAAHGKRVAFVDLDVHHCDGVQVPFYERDDVLVVSIHESGQTLFPGTGGVREIGSGKGKGYTVNLPLPVGTYDEIYEKAFREALLPVIKAYDADVLIVELGMDTLAGDPLAHLHLTNNAPARILEWLMRLDKPILATGGGGYNVRNTVRGWSLMWSILCGEDQSADLMIGMGGVMLENTDWSGGLRDRVLLSDAGMRSDVARHINASAEWIKEHVFPIHGLD